MPKTNKPIHHVKAGAISVSIWEHEHKGNKFYSANLQKSYTEDNGKTWKYSDNLNRDDLLPAARLFEQAWGDIVKKERANKIAANGKGKQSAAPAPTPENDDVPF